MTTPEPEPKPARAEPVGNSLCVSVYDDKYTVIQAADGALRALRYGEEWRDLTGDSLVLALAQEVDDLRAERDRLRADAAGRGEGVFGPERHMDEIDAAREAFGWLEALALKLPRIANEQITIEREDVGVRVYWRENKPHAVMITIRDGLNFTFGMGFNLARIAAAPAPATTDNSGDTHA